MGLGGLKAKIDNSPNLKKRLVGLIFHPVKARPRGWVLMFKRFYTKRGKGSVIYRSVRLDVNPFHNFILGKKAVIESFSVVNNAVGDVVIGDDTHMGIADVIVGPVNIGKGCLIGQNTLITGLDHNLGDATRDLIEPGITLNPITLGDYVFTGANCVIMASMGEHCILGAGSVVIKPLPAYTMCVGSPARVIKRFDMEKKEWVKATE